MASRTTVATVRRNEWGVTHDRSAGNAARTARLILIRLIQPPPRLANTGPSIPDSATNAVSDSTPNRGRTTVCGGASPLRASCRCSDLPAMRPWSIRVPVMVTIGGHKPSRPEKSRGGPINYSDAAELSQVPVSRSRLIKEIGPPEGEKGAARSTIETRITPILFPLARVSKRKPPPTNAGAARVAFVIRVRRSQ